jgi:dihydrofolate reductase
MRKLIASTFVSLDGVMQGPGAPEEDTSGGFSAGGWSMSYWDEVMNGMLDGFDGKDRELVLGRRTYEIFEAYWPYQPAHDPIAQTLNAARKHVASCTLTSLAWNNSSLLGPDIVKAIAELKAQPGLDLQIIGSAALFQTLQAAALVDEYHVWTFPVVLGRGKRLFEPGARAEGLKLLASKTSTTGVVMSTYVPAGEIPLGTMEQPEPSAKELARRDKLARGEF